jgi:hypothetical protein
VEPANSFWRLVIHRIEAISSLSVSEYIKFVASFNAISDGDTSDVDNRGYSAEQLKIMTDTADKAYPGCVSAGISFSRPLKYFKSDILGYSLTLFENYERGILPFPGSTSEQPAQIMEVFGLIQSLRNERQVSHRRNTENGRQQYPGLD